MSTQRPITNRDSSAHKASLASSSLPTDTQKQARTKRGELSDDHPERLKQAAENMAEIEDEKVMGENDFGTPSPGPARSPGSEH